MSLVVQISTTFVPCVRRQSSAFRPSKIIVMPDPLVVEAWLNYRDNEAGASYCQINRRYS